MHLFWNNIIAMVQSQLATCTKVKKCNCLKNSVFYQSKLANYLHNPQCKYQISC